MDEGRQQLSTGAPWESIVGYSRAVRVGNTIEVSGTTAVVDGKMVGEGDMYLQTTTILQKIKDAIENLGGSIHHVVRTRAYITEIEQWEAFARAHALFFSDIRPASSLIGVSRLIEEKMLVEIEATAIIT